MAGATLIPFDGWLSNLIRERRVEAQIQALFADAQRDLEEARRQRRRVSDSNRD